jgi:phage terminase Nu1 subunit (DNA packaging protein)
MMMKKCSGSELARLLGITPRRVAQLVDEGVFKLDKAKDTYDAAFSVQAYIAKRESVLAESYGKGEFGRARAQLYTERAAKMKLEREKLEGSLVLRSETESSWGQTFVLIRTRMLAIPAKLALRLAMMKTPGECKLRPPDIADFRD